LNYVESVTTKIALHFYLYIWTLYCNFLLFSRIRLFGLVQTTKTKNHVISGQSEYGFLQFYLVDQFFTIPSSDRTFLCLVSKVLYTYLWKRRKKFFKRSWTLYHSFKFSVSTKCYVKRDGPGWKWYQSMGALQPRVGLTFSWNYPSPRAWEPFKVNPSYPWQEGRFSPHCLQAKNLKI
jgi:hypothetical protein